MFEHMNLCRTFSHGSLNSNQENTAPGRKPQQPRDNKQRRRHEPGSSNVTDIYWEFSLVLGGCQSSGLFTSHSSQSQTHLTLSQEPPLPHRSKPGGQIHQHPACPSKLPTILLFRVLELAWLDTWPVFSSASQSASCKCDIFINDPQN